MKQLFDKIQEELKSKRLDKSALAKQIGVARGTVYNLNEGTAIGTVFKIIEALGKTPVQFLKELETEIATKETGSIKPPPVVDYQKNYIETLEKLNYANEQLLKHTSKSNKKP